MWAEDWIKHFDHVNDRKTNVAVTDHAVQIARETCGVAAEINPVEGLLLHKAEMLFLDWLDTNHPRKPSKARKKAADKPQAARKPRASTSVV